MPRMKQFQNFFIQTCGRYIPEYDPLITNKILTAFIDTKTQFGGKTNGPDHAHRVFTVTIIRITDETQSPLHDIFIATDIIDHGKISHIVIQRINSKITSPDILLKITINIVTKNTSRFILMTQLRLPMMTTKSSNLDNVTTKMNMRQPESTPN